jgi:SH3 domain-containing YSC84-like protein 1
MGKIDPGFASQKTRNLDTLQTKWLSWKRRVAGFLLKLLDGGKLMRFRFMFEVVVMVLMLTTTSVFAVEKAVERCETAAKVLDEIMGTPEKSVPEDLISKAQCIAIAPGVKKAGLGFGGQYGKGVLVCRGKGGNGWTGPSTVRLEGGSFGLQIGGSSTDVIMLVMNERGQEKLLQSRFTIGADAAAAAGPVGREAQAQTDAQMHAEILSYSRSRGIFAGISLEGSTLRQDADDNRAIYGKPVTPYLILNGDVAPPPSVNSLLATLNKYSKAKTK